MLYHKKSFEEVGKASRKLLIICLLSFLIGFLLSNFIYQYLYILIILSGLLIWFFIIEWGIKFGLLIVKQNKDLNVKISKYSGICFILSLSLFCMVFGVGYGVDDNIKVSDPIRPGVGIQSYNLGYTRSEFLKMGFVVDPDRGKKYLKKGSFLIMLKDDIAAMIFYDGNPFSLMGKNSIAMKDINKKLLESSFNPCVVEKGSGGEMLYCQKKGIRFDFDYHDKYLGLAIQKKGK